MCEREYSLQVSHGVEIYFPFCSFFPPSPKRTQGVKKTSTYIMCGLRLVTLVLLALCKASALSHLQLADKTQGGRLDQLVKDITASQIGHLRVAALLNAAKAGDAGALHRFLERAPGHTTDGTPFIDLV